MNITILARSVYGVVRYYVDGPLQEPISVLTGQKSLTESQVHALEALGFTVTIKPTV